MVIYLSIPLLSLYLGFLPLTLNNKLFREYVNGRWIETKEDGDVAVLFTFSVTNRLLGFILGYRRFSVKSLLVPYLFSFVFLYLSFILCYLDTFVVLMISVFKICFFLLLFIFFVLVFPRRSSFL